MKKIFVFILSCFLIGKCYSQDTNETDSEYLIKDILVKESDISIMKAIFNKYENVRNFIPNISPMYNGRIKSFFGSRLHPIYKQVKFHNGLDIVSDDGLVYSTINGIVTNVSSDSENGNYVVIENHYGFKVIFCHLSEIYVEIGQAVFKGKNVAMFGDTGTATSKHLHYVIKKNDIYMNPLLFLREW